MAKISIRNIYQQSNLLEEQLPLIPFMKAKWRNIFVKEIQILLDAARQAEQNTTSHKTKSRLQDIVEAWEELIIKIKNIPTREPLLISQLAKTSHTSNEIEEEDFFAYNSSKRKARFASQIFSPGKVDLNSPLPVLFDPKLRALHDELSGIIDVKGE
jgi:hypothetical protein